MMSHDLDTLHRRVLVCEGIMLGAISTSLVLFTLLYAIEWLQELRQGAPLDEAALGLLLLTLAALAGVYGVFRFGRADLEGRRAMSLLLDKPTRKHRVSRSVIAALSAFAVSAYFLYRTAVTLLPLVGLADPAVEALATARLATGNLLASVVILYAGAIAYYVDPSWGPP